VSLSSFPYGNNPWDSMKKTVLKVSQKKGRYATVMASVGARAYMGVWELCPQWGAGAKPLVKGSGGVKPPEAGAYFTGYVRVLHTYITYMVYFLKL